MSLFKIKEIYLVSIAWGSAAYVLNEKTLNTHYLPFELVNINNVITITLPHTFSMVNKETTKIVEIKTKVIFEVPKELLTEKLAVALMQIAYYFSAALLSSESYKRNGACIIMPPMPIDDLKNSFNEALIRLN